MSYRVLAAQEVAPEHLTVRRIDIPFVQAAVSLGVFTIESGQPIPRHSRMHVVYDVKIVVQKKKRQRAAILDDYGTGPGLLMCLMFKKCSNSQQRKSQIAANRVSPERHG